MSPRRFHESSLFFISVSDLEEAHGCGGEGHSCDGSMNIGGTTVSVHKGIVRAGRVSYGLVPSGSRVFAKKMNDGSVLITVNGERRYPETQKVNTGRGGTLPQPKLMGK